MEPRSNHEESAATFFISSLQADTNRGQFRLPKIVRRFDNCRVGISPKVVQKLPECFSL